MTVTIEIPEFSLVILIGPTSAGKSTFAAKHFLPTEVLSSDFCRALVSDDENNLAATKDAFDVLHFIARKRLTAGRLTVIDATNVKREDRKLLLDLAREYHALAVGIVFDLPKRIYVERNGRRTDRNLPPHVIQRQLSEMRRSLHGLRREGFHHVHIFDSPETVNAVAIERRPLWCNLKHEQGPFDIIGDVHGCFDELVTLLGKLGYQINQQPTTAGSLGFAVHPPASRKAIFVGDLVDRGPDAPGVLRLVMSMVEAGHALCVPGNHDAKLVRALKGRNVQITHGLGETLEQLKAEPPEFSERVKDFLDRLVSHYVLDGGRLVVAHAGMKQALQGRASRWVRDFALYGETTGETDELGLPVRYEWAAGYRGRAIVVYGHTPVAEPEWINNTINIDTGCVFGGRLTALRYPEREIVSAPARQTYYEPIRPFLAEGEQAPSLVEQRKYTDLLDIEDVSGKRIINTRLYRNVTIREENALAALEVMSRFAVNPRWLIYLPPTMSPTETSEQPGLLEHPAEAFSYYRIEGLPTVVCEEKHMGSRAVVIVCRDEGVVRERFGVVDEGTGLCYTRTGRRFFDEVTVETEFLTRIRSALETSGLWEEMETDWICLDCELMPWSAKAQELLRQQYAAVGAASRAALDEAVKALEQAAGAGADIGALLENYRERADMASQYVDAYRHYCWPVSSVADLKLAPFHILATEGAVHIHRDHLWHMETLAKLCQADEELLLATPYRVVDVTDPASQEEAVSWWEELTGRGQEGMVVKPLDFVAQGQRGMAQPAVKCRGREYLRIIYGLEYTALENLERLRWRSLGAKRSLALREFALGIEALERFVRHEPLYRIHECVFGVLALESEPVDPRL
jgi:protein phosphatase